MPADGTTTAHRPGDFGTSPWQLHNQTIPIPWSRVGERYLLLALNGHADRAD